MTSEDPDFPIEAALLPGRDQGWRAAVTGKQTIRLHFIEAQNIQRIQVSFLETIVTRTQEFLISCSHDNGRSFKEVVRQQWNFSPDGSTSELEDYTVALTEVTDIELKITPDTSGKSAYATLAKMHIA